MIVISTVIWEGCNQNYLVDFSFFALDSLEVVDNLFVFCVEFAFLFVDENSGIFHYFFIALSDNGDSKVQQYDENEHLVHEPDKPDQEDDELIDGVIIQIVPEVKLGAYGLLPVLKRWWSIVSKRILHSLEEIT